MATGTTAPTTDVLSAVVVERARAEACEAIAMLDFRDAELDRTETTEPPMRRLVERSAIALEIGQAMGLSEAQVHLRLAAASRVRGNAPIVWAAFREGRIDLGRVRDIASAIEKLHRTESVERLDRQVVDYASGHTATELRAWLKRFVRRVEADLATERADEERARRHVSVTHTDDSMAWLNAYLPSHQAATIEARLHREARRPVEPDDADDDRTVAQREADLFVAWTTTSTEHAETMMDANIAVTIPADVLAGAIAGFAESTDGRWAVPAGWIATIAATGNSFWHRIVFEPVTGDVLTHEYLGRYAPHTLATALRFLHGVCQAPGCMVPAERCDLDHREPHPRGPTSGPNMGPLCRKHHTLKGHGFLHWTTGPPRPATITLRNEPVYIAYVAA